MPIKECTVSFQDSRKIVHSATVYAETVLEAAAAGLKAIRGQDAMDDDAVLELTVEVTTRTRHCVPLARLKAWLESSSPNPREQARKARLRV